MPDAVGPGDRILLWTAEGRRFLLDVEEGTSRVAGLGVIDGKRLLGQPWGASLRLGDQDYRILRPTLGDALTALERKAQVILAKDAARIVLECGIGPGTRVAEAGVGSGSLTTVLAHAVGDEGHVDGFDLREDHLRVAKANVARMGWGDRVAFHVGDIAESEPPQPWDAIVLDVPDPGRVVPAVIPALAVGGTLACYTPLVSQMEAAAEAMRNGGLGDVRSLELLERGWLNRGSGSRPDMRMLGHTGFLSFGRRVLHAMK